MTHRHPVDFDDLDPTDRAIVTAGGRSRTTWEDVEQASDPDTRRQLVSDGLLSQHPDYSGLCRLTEAGQRRNHEIRRQLDGQPPPTDAEQEQWLAGMGHRPPLDLVGLQEIADRLDVHPQTVRAWRSGRDVGLPEEDWSVSGRPVWRWETVERWARETGRL